MKKRISIALAVLTLTLSASARPASAQVTPAQGYTPPDDAPSVKVGGTLFLDYTFQDEPETRDAGGNRIPPTRSTSVVRTST